MEMNGYLHIPDTLSQGKRAPYTPVVGLIAGLDILEKKKKVSCPSLESK